MLLVFQNGFWVYIYSYKKQQEKTFFDSSICRVEINRALKRLEAAKQEGKLEEYLQAPNLLYSMLTHPKMTIDYVERSLMDLFVGGVESVKRSFVFSLTMQDSSFFVHILITTSNILILEMKFFEIKIILHFTSPLIIDIKYFDVLMVWIGKEPGKATKIVRGNYVSMWRWWRHEGGISQNVLSQGMRSRDNEVREFRRK